MNGKLYIIGLGPGRPEGLTFQARAALDDCQVVVGYKTYLGQAKPALTGQRLESSGMTQELGRAARAVDLALAGERVALVSGGDPGVYAMAGVVFELVNQKGLVLGQGEGRLDLEIVPGVPALAAGAALLGAPLTHDFATVSLSDRLTAWATIERRLDAAAGADFVIVLYNPKSKGRPWQFGRAVEIIAAHRPGSTPVGLVSRAMRQGQSLTLTDLASAAGAEVDMQTVVFVGNSNSFVVQGRLVTPRGYMAKHGYVS